MRAFVGQNNVHPFVNSLVFLSKIGPDLCVETTTSTLKLSVLAPTQTSYAQCVFTEAFFGNFTHSTDDAGQPILVKTSLLSKTISHCASSLNQGNHIEILISDDSEQVMELKIVTKTKMKKHYMFACTEQMNPLKPDVTRANCTSALAIKPAALSACLRFVFGVDEISLILKQEDNQFMAIKSHCDPDNDSKEVLMMSEYTIPSDEFSRFDVKDQALNDEITFCMREFQAMLAMCANCDSLLHMFFVASGKPVIFSNTSKKSTPFAVSLVIATIEGIDERQK